MRGALNENARAAISQVVPGRRLDVVVTMDRSCVFAPTLVCEHDGPVALSCVREDVRDGEIWDGRVRRGSFFGNRTAPSGSEDTSELKGATFAGMWCWPSGVRRKFGARIGEYCGESRRDRCGGGFCWTRLRSAACDGDEYFAPDSIYHVVRVWLAGSNGMGRNFKGLVAASGQQHSTGAKHTKR